VLALAAAGSGMALAPRVANADGASPADDQRLLGTDAPSGPAPPRRGALPAPPAVPAVHSVDGTPLAEAAVATWIAHHGEVPAPPPERRALAIPGQAENFYTIDLETHEFLLIQAELRAMSASTVVYVESSEWGSRVTQGDVDRVLAAFDESTPSGSVNPGEGIATIVETHFGPPTDKDGDGRIHILILDVRDGYRGAGGFVAGYYSSHDQTDLFGSNRRDLLYVDCSPGDASGDGILATIAHEYQHLVHYARDRDEGIFVNEGLSEFSTHICGYGLRRFSSYFMATDVPLDSWSNSEADYARVLLWTLYLGEQLGLPFIRALFEEPANGVAGIENVLSSAATPRGFPDLLADWFVANVINDRTVDPRFGYLTTFSGTAQPVDQHLDYPVNRSTSVSQLASDLVSFRNVNGLSLRLDGSGLSPRVVRRGPQVPAVVIELPLGQNFGSPDLGSGYDELLLVASALSRFSASYTYTAAAIPSRIREIAYDDGAADQTGVLSPAEDRGLAVRFTPEVHLARLRAASIIVGDTSAFDLQVWDDNGPGGGPGSILIPAIRVIPLAPHGSQSVDLSAFGIEITSGDFYVGAMGLPSSDLSLGLDLSPPIDDRSYLFDHGVWQRFSEIGLEDIDLMIRAEVEYEDLVAPELAIGLLQHPVFTEEADLYVTGDKALLASSLRGVMRLAGEVDSLFLVSVGFEERVFVDDTVRLSRAGEGEIEISGTSRYGAVMASELLRFFVGEIGVAGGEMRLASAAGQTHLTIPDGALARSTLLTMQSAAVLPGGPTVSPAAGAQLLILGPGTMELGRAAELRVSGCPPEASPGGLARWNGAGWEPVPARAVSGGLEARLDRLGIYALMPDGLPEAPPADRLRLVALSPQPMGDEGMLTVDLPGGGRVRVRIYDVNGRLRVTAFAGQLPAGRQVVPLDLLRLPNGPYFIEVATDHARSLGKIVRLD
jgi:hypothetical protein